MSTQIYYNIHTTFCDSYRVIIKMKTVLTYEITYVGNLVKIIVYCDT